MSSVIKVENLGKKYIISHQRQGGYVALRDVMAESAKRWGNKLLHPFAKGNGGEVTHEEFWALKDVSFEVKQGETLGIIGRNGAGKSTLLKILSRITEPTTGRVKIKGRIASLLEVGTGFHPELTGRENVFLNGAILGMTRAEIKSKFDEIVAFAEVEKFLDTPVKRYSSGMYVRLAFAVAAHLEPEILLVDEVLAVGDVAFQKKCLGKMGDVAKDGRTVLFISHNMGAVQQLTNRSILLNNGNLLMDADTFEVVEGYLEKSPGSAVNTTLKTNQDSFKVNSISFNYDVLESGFNKPLQFDLNLSVEKSKYDVLLGFAIINSIAAKILVSECVIEKLLPGTIDLSLILKNHHLPPGHYTINLGIGIQGSSILYEENVLAFEISDLNIDNPTLVRKRDKIGAFIPCEWILR